MEIIIFIGIQATGKSSFYKERFFNTHIRINLDMLKTRHRENVLLKACLEAKQPFVVDNTNPAIEERKKYIKLAQAASFRVIGYYFKSNLEEAIKRNDSRTEKDRVPLKGVLGTYKRLHLPSFAEGFDSLYYVRIEDNRFVVEAWADEV